MLPPEVHSVLAQLLSGLQSPDNVARTQAEETLNNDWVNAQTEILLMGLAEQIQLAEDAGVRLFGGTGLEPGLTLLADAFVRLRIVQAHFSQEPEGSRYRPDQGTVPHTPGAATQCHPRQDAAVSRGRAEFCREEQDRRRRCRAR